MNKGGSCILIYKVIYIRKLLGFYRIDVFPHWWLELIFYFSAANQACDSFGHIVTQQRGPYTDCDMMLFQIQLLLKRTSLQDYAL